MLLAGAALLVRSSVRLAQIDRGFVSNGVLTFDLKPSLTTYQTPEQRARLYARIETALAGLPGVTAIGLAHRLPLTGMSVLPMRIVGRSAAAAAATGGAESGDTLQINVRSISADYFQVLRVGLVRGRIFTKADAWERGDAVVINQAAARRFFPNEDPIGQRLIFGTTQPPIEIVGVVADSREVTVRGPAEPMVFFPYLRWPAPAMTVATLAPARRALRIDPVRTLRAD